MIVYRCVEQYSMHHINKSVSKKEEERRPPIQLNQVTRSTNWLRIEAKQFPAVADFNPGAVPLSVSLTSKHGSFVYPCLRISGLASATNPYNTPMYCGHIYPVSRVYWWVNLCLLTTCCMNVAYWQASRRRILGVESE